MYRHILIPTYGSQLSCKAIEHGVALAKSVNSKVTAVTVSVPFHVFSFDHSPQRQMGSAATPYASSTRAPIGPSLIWHHGKSSDLIDMASHARRVNFRDRSRERNRQSARLQGGPSPCYSRATDGLHLSASVSKRAIT